MSTLALGSTHSLRTHSSIPNGSLAPSPENIAATNIISDVLYSEMFSGNWSIVIEAYDIDFSVQRDVEIVAGILPKATVTVSVSGPVEY